MKTKFFLFFFFFGIFKIFNAKNKFTLLYNFSKNLYLKNFKNLFNKEKSLTLIDKTKNNFFKKEAETNIQDLSRFNEKLNKFLYGENYYSNEKKKSFLLQNYYINININFPKNNENPTKNFYKKAFLFSLSLNFLQYGYHKIF